MTETKPLERWAPVGELRETARTGAELDLPLGMRRPGQPPCESCPCPRAVPDQPTGLWARLREDVRTVFARDPAARTVLEVLLCYPGLHAVWLHRVAHWLWGARLLLLARLVSHFNRFCTGIEIHPAATLGRRCFIDHGMGVVIGETAEVGDDVLIYKGVVLGGVSMDKKKRHPTIEDDVIIYSGATILGGDTVIGARSVIGGNVWITESVPPDTTVMLESPKLIYRKKNKEHP